MGTCCSVIRSAVRPQLCSMLCDCAGGPGEDHPLPGEAVEGWGVKEPLREEPTGALDLGRLL